MATGPDPEPRKFNPGWLLALFFGAVLAVGGYLTWEALAPDGTVPPLTGGPAAGPLTGDSGAVSAVVAGLPDLVAAREAADAPRLQALLVAVQQLYRAKRYPDAAAACREVLARTGWDDQTRVAFHTLGNIYDDLGQYGDAAFCYRQALRVQPGPQLEFNLALAEYHRRDWRAAKTAATAALAADPRPEHRLLLGMIRTAAGDRAGGFADLEAAALADPGSFVATVNYAEALAADGSDSGRVAAREELIRALKLLAPAERTRQATLRLAGLYAAADDPNDAIGLYLQVLPRTPNDPVLQHNLGACRLQAGLYADAAGSLARAVQLDPARYESWYALSDALERNGRLAEAIAARQRGLERDSRNVAEYGRLGELFLKASNLEAARRTFLQMAELGEGTARAVDAHARLMLLYRSRGQYADALRHGAEAIRRAPGAAWVRFDLGLVRQDAGDQAGATVAFRDAVARDGQNPLYRQAVAESLYRERKYPEAIAAYEEWLGVSPANATANRFLGYLHQERRELDAARQCYTAALAVEFDPIRKYELTVNLAGVAAAAGRLDEAFGLLRQATEIQRDRAEAYLAAAALRRQRGELGEAFANLAVALEKAPRRADAHRLLGDCYLDKGLRREAAAAYTRALELNPSDLAARSALQSLAAQPGLP